MKEVVGLVSEPILEEMDELYLLSERVKSEFIKLIIINRIAELEQKLFEQY